MPDRLNWEDLGPSTSLGHREKCHVKGCDGTTTSISALEGILGIFVCSEQASPHHWLELSETYSKGGMKAAEEWKSGRIAMKKYDKPQVCRVIGCTHTSNCGTEIEDKFGIVLCDPDPDLPVSTSHYVAFFEAEDREAWIEAHCRVRCECGRERNEDDYLCPMCRYSLYEQISE